MMFNFQTLKELKQVKNLDEAARYIVTLLMCVTQLIRFDMNSRDLLEFAYFANTFFIEYYLKLYEGKKAAKLSKQVKA